MTRPTIQDLMAAPSESVELTKAIELLGVVLGERADFAADAKTKRAAAVRAREILTVLRDNATRGIHRNPGLAIYGNPPMKGLGRRVARAPGRFDFIGQMSPNVHEIRYTHAVDGKDYRHPFEGGAEMWAIFRAGRHDVLITGDRRQPMWEDFD